MSTEISGFFGSRVGKRIKWATTLVLPGKGKTTRQYAIFVCGTTTRIVTLEISWHDEDVDGKRIPQSGSGKAVSIELETPKTLSPKMAIEMAIEKVDNQYKCRKTNQNQEGLGHLGDMLNERLAELQNPQKRHQEEIEPRTDSINQFRDFLKTFPNVVFPNLFSSKNGSLRARWKHGAERSVWMTFNGEGKQISWFLSVPREGENLPRKLNGRCPDMNDIIYFVEQLGVICTV